MPIKLFNEFTPVSSKQWKQKIQFDLKGADYNEALIWQTPEDIAVKPFYHADEFSNSSGNSNTKAKNWKICQTIYVFDVEKSNIKALEILEKGVDTLTFIIPSKDIALKNLLKNIDKQTPIYFNLEFMSEDYITNILLLFPLANITIDPIGNLAKTGNWHTNITTDFNQFQSITNRTNAISIDISLYQNAGANMVQQLAYGLNHANEYLNKLDKHIPKEKKNYLKSYSMSL